MTFNYTLSPVEPLSGIHLRGTVKYRFLINYPVAPELLEPHLPPNSRLSLFAGKAWLSACFVHLKHVRPRYLPKWVGASFNYLIMRTRAVLPFPDGKEREAVLVLDNNVNQWYISKLGKSLIGFTFKNRKMKLIETSKSWIIQM